MHLMHLNLDLKINVNLSPGSCFFLPNGARVNNNLVEVRVAPHAPWLNCTL